MKRVGRRMVRSAVSGLLPWLPIALVTSPEYLGWTLSISLALSLIIFFTTLWVGDPIKNLEILDVGFFTLAAAAFVLGTSTFTEQMARWIVEASTAVIFVYALGSIVAGRPFTGQYTRLVLPQGGEQAPDVRQTDMMLSAIWAGVFGVQLACLAMSKVVLARPDDLLFAWILPIGSLIVGFVCNAVMTRRLIMRQTGTASSLE